MGKKITKINNIIPLRPMIQPNVHRTSTRVSLKKSRPEDVQSIFDNRNKQKVITHKN